MTELVSEKERDAKLAELERLGAMVESAGAATGASAGVLLADEVEGEVETEASEEEFVPGPEYKAMMEAAKAAGETVELREPKDEEDASEEITAAVASAHGSGTVPEAEPADYGPEMEEAVRLMLGGMEMVLATMAKLSPKQRSRIPSEVLRLEENLKIAHEEYHHTGSGAKVVDEEMPEELSDFLTEAEAEAMAARSAAMTAPTAVSYDDDDDEGDGATDDDSEDGIKRKAKSDFFDEPMFDE